MEPFTVPAPLRNLCDHYPDAVIVADIARKGGEQAKIALARLWLSEGIPFAFEKCPALYETVRTWLSARLSVEAKAISLTGSARLGSSLSPNKLGKPFDENSDLDLFVVSKELLEKLIEDFQFWSSDFETGRAKPNNVNEEKYWRNNNERGPKLIQRGFLDSWMIPNREKYATTRKINGTMSLLVSKLNITDLGPTPAKATLRCYSCWEDYVRQTALTWI